MTKTGVVRVLLVLAMVPAAVRGVAKKHPHFLLIPSGARDLGGRVSRDMRLVTPTHPDPSLTLGMTTGEVPLFTSDFLPLIKTDFVHAATMIELPNGDVAAAWYGGTDEVQPDVAIYLSTLDHVSKQWSTPRPIIDRKVVMRGVHMRVKSVGNPVLVAEANRLRLFFSIVMGGGWSGATICTTSSNDWGRTWAPVKHVVTSYFDAGMMVRGAAAAYDDGTLALPIYHQLSAKWAAIARVDRDGNVIDEWRIGDDRPLLQPWLIVRSPTDAVAMMRYSSRMPFSVTIAHTRDAARHWSDVAGTALVHRDSGVSGVILGDRSLLAFYNNSAWDRRDLSMARSIDDGRTWSWPFALERDVNPDEKVRREYSYPYAIRTSDGNVHVLYTFQRTRIKHVVFNDAWVLANDKLKVMR